MLSALTSHTKIALFLGIVDTTRRMLYPVVFDLTSKLLSGVWFTVAANRFTVAANRFTVAANKLTETSVKPAGSI